MKSNIATKPILKPIFASALICGSLLLPAFADDAPAAPVAAPLVTTTNAVQHKYIFEEYEVLAPGGGTVVSVRVSDTYDKKFHKRVVSILDDAGGYKRLDRAHQVAERLQAACDTDPSFVDHLSPPASVGNEVVIIDPTHPGSWLITADKGSMRVANVHTPDEYAEVIAKAIHDRLQGIKLRDAPFDYQITKPKEINERAAEYFDEAHDAYETDHDTEVATSKCELALKLEPGFNNCRLMLADLYVETKQLDKAKLLYQYIASADDADPHDKQDAADRLNKINKGSS